MVDGKLLEKAGILIEALPYIRMFFGKTFVIKYGGSAMEKEALREAVAQDIVLLKYIGVHPVLVHGGGPEVSVLMKKLGKEPRFVGGLRVTDEETVEIAEMVLAGKINKSIVALINKHGGRAVGLSGKDGNLIVAARHREVDLGFVGDVSEVEPEVVRVVSREGFIPVVSSVASDKEGRTLNINADHVAGHLAAALGADKLIFLTDVEGIFEDPNERRTLLSSLTVDEARQMIASGKVEGGMIPKLEACIVALESGVPRTHIIDGRLPHSLLLEVFTTEGIGTMVTKS